MKFELTYLLNKCFSINIDPQLIREIKKMRQIKFRVYSTVTGSLDFTSIKDVITENNSRISKKMLEDDLNIMQFIGRKDRGGVDIYEGDIVSDHVGVGVVKYSEKNGAFRVSYGDGQAKWFYDYILNGERDSIEVIGNIHQNPELLES